MRPVQANVHATAPTSPDRQDVAIVHVQGREEPVGVQVLNYLEVGRGWAPRTDGFEIDLLAAAGDARVYTPRVRENRPDLQESLTPAGRDANGVPTVPYARFLGCIEAMGEMVNSFSDAELWRLELTIAELPFHVLVRKDRCDGRPEIGHFLGGTCWLIAEFPAYGAAEGT